MASSCTGARKRDLAVTGPCYIDPTRLYECNFGLNSFAGVTSKTSDEDFRQCLKS
jgi:hypothetical protein